jgi:hypothetical protein
MLLAAAYADQSAMERVVATSNLDWTIVRVNRLTDRPPTGRVEVRPDLLAHPRSTARADVARTLLRVVEEGTFVRTAVNTTSI